MILTIEGTDKYFLNTSLTIESNDFGDPTITIKNSSGEQHMILKKKTLRNLKDYITILLKD